MFQTGFWNSIFYSDIFKNNKVITMVQMGHHASQLFTFSQVARVMWTLRTKPLRNRFC